jgi:hypothetical protein
MAWAGIRVALMPRAGAVTVSGVLDEAKQRLQEAHSHASQLAATIAGARGFGDWDGLHDAQLEVYAAEREVARLGGDEYAIVLEFDLPWDTGAPLPHLLADGRTAFLLYYLPDRDPDWDGTWVNIIDPRSAQPAKLGVVRFRRVHSVKLGGPNDEALRGHPLSGKGLQPYTAHRVVNSRWITHAEQVNSVHPQHQGGWHERLNHYVLCFHDETFECLAESFTTERLLGSPHDVLGMLVNRLLA